MKRINIRQLRQSLSKIIGVLQKTGEPVLLEKGRKPVAVIISLEEFHIRFVGKAAHESRRKIQKEILKMQRDSKVSNDSEAILRSLRST